MGGVPGAGETVMECQRAWGIEFVVEGRRFLAMGRPVAVCGREKAGWQIASSKAIAVKAAGGFEVLPDTMGC